jgi:hypothetical protein
MTERAMPLDLPARDASAAETGAPVGIPGAASGASADAIDLDAQTLLRRFAPVRRAFEVLAWTSFFVGQSVFNSATVWMDIQRVGLDFAPWEPVVWEWSSNLVLLALVPLVIAFERRVPLYLGVLRRNLPWHVLGSVVFSALHVGLMVFLRKGIYDLYGARYEFGDWLREGVYEYLKDWRAYAGILFALLFYRLVLRRLQGEAALLGEPDSGPAVEPIARPERFLVKKLGKEFLLPAAEIEWIQAWGNYVNLHLRGRDYPLRSTLAGISARLDPNTFVRVHRSYLVNLSLIEAVEPEDGGDARLLLKVGTHIPLSRTYRDSLRSRLI